MTDATDLEIFRKQLAAAVPHRQLAILAENPFPFNDAWSAAFRTYTDLLFDLQLAEQGDWFEIVGLHLVVFVERLCAWAARGLRITQETLRKATADDDALMVSATVARAIIDEAIVELRVVTELLDERLRVVTQTQVNLKPHIQHCFRLWMRKEVDRETGLASPVSNEHFETKAAQTWMTNRRSRARDKVTDRFFCLYYLRNSSITFSTRPMRPIAAVEAAHAVDSVDSALAVEAADALNESSATDESSATSDNPFETNAVALPGSSRMISGRLPVIDASNSSYSSNSTLSNTGGSAMSIASCASALSMPDDELFAHLDIFDTEMVARPRRSRAPGSFNNQSFSFFNSSNESKRSVQSN